MRSRPRSFGVGLVCAGLAVLLAAAVSPDRARAPLGSDPVEILRLDPRFDRLIPRDVVLQKIADGFDWVEGPVWRERDGALLFSDVVRNAVMIWRDGQEAAVFLRPSGYSGSEPFRGREPGSNGLAFDPDGRLVLCEHGDRRVTRIEANGERTVLVDRYEGRRLNSPNDLVFDAGGALYFTDPPFGLPETFRDSDRELDFSGVYRLTPNGRLTLLTSELTAPNGIALDPAGRTLYVSNSDPARPLYMAFELDDSGGVGAGRVLFDATALAARWKGAPDGIEVDEAGNLFVAGPGGVHVLTRDGVHLGSLITGVATSNVAWGGDDGDLYITASDAVYRVRTSTRGYRPAG